MYAEGVERDSKYTIRAHNVSAHNLIFNRFSIQKEF